MLGGAVLCLATLPAFYSLWTLHFYGVAAQGECTDIRGRTVSNGLHYIPGPDTCTLCVCESGQPKDCKAVLCSPPQDCRSFRVGATCCEFICLDDVVKPAESGAEANVRMAAGGAAVLVLLTIALVVYRVRKQKRRRNTHADDQRSLTSIGYISGSIGYISGQCETALGVWKPHGNYLPRGEAPPPYEEVVGQYQMENMRMAEGPPYHRTYPTNMEPLGRPEEICNGHGYVNIPRPIQLIPNPQNCFNAPLLQQVPTEVNQMHHHVLAANMNGVGVRARLTGSLGAISGRLTLAREPEPERPHNVPGFYTTHVHTALHRTIPRITTAIEALELGAFRRAEPGGEVRRSFHRPCAPRGGTGRSVPRHLDLASTDESSLRPMPCAGRSRAHSEDNVGGSPSPPLLPPGPPKPDVIPTVIAPPPPVPNVLPLTVDKPSCVCSYAGDEGASEAPPADEPDDYRSECENCKSASSSRWVLEEGWTDEAEEGTQTLQRRAPPTAPPAPATATLPQPVTKLTRNTVGPPSNWDNWFNTIPDSDSESE